MTDGTDDKSMTRAQQRASDQRAEIRHKVYVQVTAVAGDQVDRDAISANLSRQGVFLATPRIVPVGTRVEVQFRLPNRDSPINTLAEVAWTNEDKNFQAGKVPGYGLKFVELDDENRRELDDYMDHFDRDDWS